MRYEGEKIYEVIPNRKPLMVLDYIDILDETRARGGVKLRADSWFLQCHYPGNPIFPICLLIESMTQVFASIFYSELKEIPVVYSLGPIKMNSGATVGDILRFEATVKSNRRGVIVGRCDAIKIIGEEEVLIASIDITDVVPSKMVK